MTRCVRDKKTNQYWIHSYNSIRRLYPFAPIIIIDDNSLPHFLRHDGVVLTNCQIIKSEYNGRGELLGFYYFWKHHWFDRAVILHDSVFIHNPIDIASCQKARFLWHIETKRFDNVAREEHFLSKIGKHYLDLYRQKDKWKGCFGVMAVITHEFIDTLSDIFILLDNDIRTRDDRCCIERVLAVMCFYHDPNLIDNVSYMGDIHKHKPEWGYQYNTYKREKGKRHDFRALVKVWTGR